jgi:hypothetical protein
MGNFAQALLTAALTVLVGVVVFSLTQLIQRFVIDPIHEQAKVIGRIGYCMTFYAPWFLSPGVNRDDEGPGVNRHDEVPKVSMAIRDCASQLLATTRSIRCYDFFARWRLIPSAQNAAEAASKLICLSNAVLVVGPEGAGRQNVNDAHEVERLLGLRKNPDKEKH